MHKKTWKYFYMIVIGLFFFSIGLICLFAVVEGTHDTALTLVGGITSSTCGVLIICGSDSEIVVNHKFLADEEIKRIMREKFNKFLEQEIK